MWALAVTLANRRFIETHGARATALAAAGKAFAEPLRDLCALLVARLAANADAVFNHFTAAIAAREIAFAHTFAIPAAADAAIAARQRVAQFLHSLARDFVVAATIDLAAVRAFFNADFALRNLAAIRLTSGGCLGFHNGVGHDPFPLEKVANLRQHRSVQRCKQN